MAEMTEKELSLERLRCVFSLGGGELHEPHPDFPDEWDPIFEGWYEGLPNYASLSELGLTWDDDVRTALVCEVYGPCATPKGWRRVTSYSTSGGSECGWCGDGTGNEEERDGCKLCGGSGYVYLGEGYAEVVFAALPDEDHEDWDEDHIYGTGEGEQLGYEEAAYLLEHEDE